MSWFLPPLWLGLLWLGGLIYAGLSLAVVMVKIWRFTR